MFMLPRSDVSQESSAHLQASTAVLQNRAFVELSRVLVSGEPAVLSSALPLIVRGAGIPSAALFATSDGDLTILAADGVPLALRAYLDEPAWTSAPDFIARRAARLRRTIIDARVFGPSAPPELNTALEEAGWQGGVAIPILAAGEMLAVILAGARAAGTGGATVVFLESMANLLGAALGRPSGRRGPFLPPVAFAACVTPVVEGLGALGREVAAQHGLVRDLSQRPGAPPETDALLGHTRALDRNFRRLCDAVLHPPMPEATNGRRPTSMATIVDAAVHASRPALAAAGAELSVVCAPACDFDGDPALMTLAVRHLVVNAAEAFTDTIEAIGAPSGRRCVRVCVRTESGNAAVHVEDSGPGIPHDLRARVFEPSVSTKGPGRGLGLAVARNVVEGHAGWMELGGSDLGGARLSIFVPARSSALDQLRRMPTVPQMPAQSTTRRRVPDELVTESQLAMRRPRE
jgi:signal transduction histidine kinase